MMYGDQKAFAKGIARVIREAVDQKVAALRDELRADISDARTHAPDAPELKHRGQWQTGEWYRRGESCDWAGDEWICCVPVTANRPGLANGDWQRTTPEPPL